MTIVNADRPIYRKLLWSGDQITGAIFVGQANDLGMLNDVGMVKGIMQTKSALGPWKELFARILSIFADHTWLPKWAKSW